MYNYDNNNINIIILFIVSLLLFRWFTWFYLWGVIWNAIILYYYVSVHLFSQSTPLLKPLIFSLYIAFYPYQPQETTCCCTQQHLEVLLALILVCFQIGRRLYESLFITEFGSSKMHLLHFVYGVFFYTALGPAVLSHLSKCKVKLYMMYTISIARRSIAPLLSNWPLCHYLFLV